MIIRHDRSDRQSLVDPCKWPAITGFFRASGGCATLIAPTWLLTAAHVATRIPTNRRITVELKEKRYAIARMIIHPEFNPTWEELDQSESYDTVDLALVELETPVENIQPYALYINDDEQGQEIAVLGMGQHGDGLTGGRGSDRQLRRVTNFIDEANDYWLKFRFDAPPDGTFLEGVAGNGDSGGPAFIQRDSQLLLAGVSSWQKTPDETNKVGLYGCVEHYTRVSRFVDWIRATCAHSL